MPLRSLSLAALGALVLFFSCEQVSSTATPKVETIEWVTTHDGFARFSTNDPQYYQYTFWDSWSEAYANGLNMTVLIEKASGSPNVGAGIQFGVQADGGCYEVLINANGQYCVLKIWSNRTGFDKLVAWNSTPSPALYRGIGVVNELKIVQLTNPAGFQLVINGRPLDTVSDATYSSGGICLISGVGPADWENFPAQPADNRIRMMEPFPYPTANMALNASVGRSALRPF